jgi:hypothetical protein
MRRNAPKAIMVAFFFSAFWPPESVIKPFEIPELPWNSQIDEARRI